MSRSKLLSFFFALPILSGAAHTRPASDEATSEVPRHDHAAPTTGVRAAPARQLSEPPAGAATARRDHSRLYHVAGNDGAHWVRGTDYKASFGAEGAVFIPFLGSAAPRNYPLELDLAHVSVGGLEIAFEASVAASREQDTIVYDRGTLFEVYDVELGSIEQKFVFESLPGSGELVVRIAVTSELAGEQDGEGLAFRNELGGVRYGRATALDAGGASIFAPTSWTGLGIEIRVPAEFVASARFPLTIDPVVGSFGIDMTSEDDSLPDVAYDASADRWLSVYEEVFSALDHDIVYSLLGSTGALISSSFVDGSLADNYANPAVANSDNANQFLVVAQVGPVGSRVIRGRTFAAGTAMLGLEFLISEADQTGDKSNPDVGGDPLGGTTSFYAVVWERYDSPANRDIHARCVSQFGTLIGTQTILIDNSSPTWDMRPSIAKGSNGVEWPIAWNRDTGLGHHDIRGALLDRDGTINAASFSIDATAWDDSHPDVSTRSDAGQYLVVNQRGPGGGHDVMARLMTGTVTTDLVNLTALEHSLGAGNLDEDQVRPSTDCDGTVFVVGYAESFGGSATDYDPRLSTLSVISDELRLTDNHVSFFVGQSSAREDYLSVASTAASDGAPRRCFVVWHEATVGPNLGNVEGALFDAGQYTSFCHPGVDGTLPCPCANPPSEVGRGCDNGLTGGAKLQCVGTASLSDDSMQMNSSAEFSTALSIFAQGNALTNVAFGQGVRCAGGSIERLYTRNAVNGSASAPGGGDQDVHTRSATLGDVIAPGSSRYYFVYYRTLFIQGGCPATSTFNTTQTVQAIWQP